MSTQDFLVVFAVGRYVIRFTAISTFAYCVSVSISAFNDGPIVKTSHQIKRKHPNDMPENSRSQLIILRNTRWVFRLSVLEVFCDAYNVTRIIMLQP